MESSVGHSIEVWDKIPGADAADLLHEMHELGISRARSLRIIHVYHLEGKLDSESLDRLGRQLLSDPIAQGYRTCSSSEPGSIEVAYNPGVMDPREESIKKAAADLGIQLDAVRTALKYVVDGEVTNEDLRTAADRLFMNRTVQHAVLPGEPVQVHASEYRFHLGQVQLLAADHDTLERISRDGQLWLTLPEMLAIQQHYRSIGRNPTDVELETLAQTWSEHCVHKTLKGDVRWRGGVIRNLLKSTIARVTEEINADWCLSVFRDNAGVIAFDDDYAVCFKVETHNHPSALEPYGGASTGLGGVIRDVLGTGLSAKPFLNTDVFCFGPPDYSYERLPKGTLHPRRVMKGVRAGVADYGNRIGIPTVNGAVLFDERYVGNPLVFCGTAGIMKREYALPGRQSPGDRVVVMGGRTGRDGIHGATFSSGELTSESETVSATSVQIGNPITEKKMLDALMQARDRGLIRRITDCGAGGLSSACGEMGEDTGVEIHLDRAPVKYRGLSYTEIWISEAQERMVLAVAPEHLDDLLALCAAEDVEATVIGSFTNDHMLRLFYHGNAVGDLPMDFLHHGVPRLEREAAWEAPEFPSPEFPCPPDLTGDLKNILGSLNVCSKEWIIRQYDHEVQGGSVLKPLVGVENDGPGDAAIVRPRLDSLRGVVVGCGINPHYGDLNPYAMAASCIDEAIRQVVAVGASPERIALLDNFSWGNTAKPDRLGALVLACQACYDTARAYGAPFISGKDSLNNEYVVDGQSICIPHTLLISAITVMEDVRIAVSMDAKQPGNLLYVVGLTRRELGGSHYYLNRRVKGGQTPGVDTALGAKVFAAVHRAIREGVVKSCHDCSEGGIGVAAAEMAFAGGLGLDLQLIGVPCDGAMRCDEVLFSESNSRFLLEVAHNGAAKFESMMSGVPNARIGEFTRDTAFRVRGEDGGLLVDSTIGALKDAWQKTLQL